MTYFKLFFSFIIMGIPILGFTQPNQVLLFIDSKSIGQNELVENINRELQFSPTLNTGIDVQIIDIQGGIVPRFNALRYRVDTDGEWVVRYKPRSLPWLICSAQKKSSQGFSISNHDAIRRCLTY
ncbi:hypothetical protein OP862_03705 [Yersinia massiliensis]|uniref:Uncharacterized protein n=1 Tax=Yersinia massiliensis TaxID=419257 RepID=A0AA91B8J8_9GAMM|nr:MULTISPECIES: hypothetical protein [Yersinia]MDA5548881.1 hypothetical protein [Yersinia massiliensis]NIL28327.1 hypothetical protein [Yersinia massiliensis]OWF72147.1 hypothetical protein B4902_14485 [Yersinia frederiksenii]PHZ22752.1 hypothetical protein CS535_15395 [Yersinia massiliensis]UZM79794.1 hypothetical protein OP862_03705 [Yersinia massiliensis]